MPRIASYRLTRAESELRCPCCGQRRTADEYQTFQRQLRQLSPPPAPQPPAQSAGDYLWHRLREYPNAARWACDLCLETDRATLAQPQRQYHGYGDFPHFAYYDLETACRDCGQPVTFSRSEQQHWYETLRFRLQVTRIRCQPCTQRKRTRAELSRLLAEPDYADLARTRRIIDLYLQFGQLEAAKHYLALSRRAFPVGSPEFHQLREWRAAISAPTPPATPQPDSPV